MKYEFKYGDQIPMGFVAEAAAKSSKAVRVKLAGFHSSEDGNDMITCLEGISSTILDMLPTEKRPRESQIDHLVAVVRKDKTATVYVNELAMTAKVRSKKAVKAGEPVRKDDIADIHEVDFEGIDIPADAGVVIILSIGWRKGLYFDYTPIAPDAPQPRAVDIKVLLAEIYTYLAFQDRFKVTEEQWAELFRQRWFPFIGMSTDQQRAILNHAALKAPIDTLLDDMVEDAKRHSVGLREMIFQHSALGPHRATLTKALEHFEADDYVSCATMLFPRIEGIMRQRKDEVLPGRSSQARLAEAAVADPGGGRHSLSLLLPQKFREFLDEVYFADFDPSNIKDVSRNTVSHGVAPEAQFTFKSAFMAVLILEQIVRLMPPADTSVPAEGCVQH